MFTPRTHENGRICCSSPTVLCEKCRKHFGLPSLLPPVMPKALAVHDEDYFFKTTAADPPPRMRLLRTRDDVAANLWRDASPPNPYAPALRAAAERAAAITPDLDPRYDPFGQPPNGYAIGLAMRREGR